MGTRPSGLVWPTWNPYVCLSIAHRAQASCWGGARPRRGTTTLARKGPRRYGPVKGRIEHSRTKPMVWGELTQWATRQLAMTSGRNPCQAAARLT